MEQILTIEEEKKYIAKYFHDVFHVSESVDEFTGEKISNIYLSDFINYDKDFFDVDFKEVATKEGLQDIKSTYEIKSVTDDFLSSLGRSRGFDDSADGAVFNLQEKYQKRAHLDCNLQTIISSKQSKPEYKLNIHFRNYSHNRDMIDLHCYLLSKDGVRCEILTENAKKNHSSSDYDFDDSASVTITEDAARILTQKGSKISVRFDNLRINGVVDIFRDDSIEFESFDSDIEFEKIEHNIKQRDKKVEINLDKFIDMANVYIESISEQKGYSIFTDEQIDDLFEYCKQEDEHHKMEVKKAEQNTKIEKKDLEKKKKIKYANDTLEKAISLNIDSHLFDTLELLLTDPMKLKEINALKDYCEENNVKSKNSEWLFSINEKYDSDTILKDIRRCKKQLQKKIKRKKMIGVVLLLLGILGVIFGCVYDEDGGYGAIGGISCGVLITIGWFVLKIQPQVFYNEVTAAFVNEFEKRFPKRNK